VLLVRRQASGEAMTDRCWATGAMKMTLAAATHIGKQRAYRCQSCCMWHALPGHARAREEAK
jgi:hypothetical protein